jgi:hypothetical protein
MASLEDLEKRLAALEQEVARLRQRVAPVDETLAQQGAHLLREAKADAVASRARVTKIFAAMGIPDEPEMTVEELRQQIGEQLAAAGIKPEDNVFSREIIAMREE